MDESDVIIHDTVPKKVITVYDDNGGSGKECKCAETLDAVAKVASSVASIEDKITALMSAVSEIKEKCNTKEDVQCFGPPSQLSICNQEPPVTPTMYILHSWGGS